jgi:hypothetical protein
MAVAVAVPIFRGLKKFKAHQSGTFAARGEFFMRVKSGFVGQAVPSVRDLIDPRLRDRLAWLIERRLDGMGSHVLG